PCGADLADGVIDRVGNVDVACAVDRHAARVGKARGGARAVRAAKYACVAGQGRRNPRSADLADGVVGRVGNVDVARAVDRHTERVEEARGGTRAVRAAQYA